MGSQKAFSCIPTFAIQCTDTLTINSNNFVWLLCEMKYLHYIVFFLVVFAAKFYGARPNEGKEPWCNLPKESGLCEAESSLWYFNRQTGVCEEFSYGGCGGNKNKFGTKEECMRACAP